MPIPPPSVARSRSAKLWRGFVPLLALGACRSYEPAPVDLAAHGREFAVRLPDATALRTFLPPSVATAAAAGLSLDDGLSRREGRLVAAALHPSCRVARARAATAAAESAYAGRLEDPELAVDFERILEAVPHRWLAASSLGIGIPLGGRLGAERDLADAELVVALTELRLAEERAAHALDVAWVEWSAAASRLECTRNLCTRLTELSGIAKRLAEAGAATTMQARAFELELLERRLEADRQADELALAALAVNERLGLAPTATPSLLPELPERPFVPDGSERRRRAVAGPRTASADAAHATAERRLALEIARQRPELVLAPGWSEEDAQPRATFGFSLPMPLWNRNAGPIAAAEADRAVAAEGLRAAVELAEHALAAAERRYAAAERRVRDRCAELLPLAERQLTDAKRLAELGTLDPFLVLDALVRVHDAEQQLLTDAERAAIAAVELDTFAWTDPLPMPVPGTAR